MTEIYINEHDLSVYVHQLLAWPNEGFLWRRIPVPVDLVAKIVRAGPNGFPALVYWCDQWDIEDHVTV